MHTLVVDDRSGFAEIGHVHEDASEVLRERADGLVEGNPRRRAGAIRVQEEHWLPRADVVVVDRHAPGLDGLARPCLCESVRCDERHVCLLAGWSLMLLMFAVGVGNLGWMLVLGALMAIEKNLPWGRRFSIPLGIALLCWGLTLGLQAVLAPS